MSILVDRVVRLLHLSARRHQFAPRQRIDPLAAQALACVAHELRQPVSALIAALQVTRSSPHETRREQANAVIDRQLHQLITMIDDLVEATRLRVLLPPLRLSRVDLGKIAHDVVDALVPQAAAKHQHLSIGISHSGVTVNADPTRMRQVLSNLVTNALRYTEEGGFIRVSIEKRGIGAVLTVSDSGRGIPRKLRRRIFDPFVQGESPSAHGLGLGLAVTRHLVELHGGKIRVESPGTGCGSTFVVTLPAQTTSASAHRGAVHSLH